MLISKLGLERGVVHEDVRNVTPQLQQIKITFTKKLRAHCTRGIFSTIQFSLLSSHLLSKNVKIKIYKTTILPLVLYTRGIWSFTIREEYGLMVSKNKLRKILGPKMEELA
jgi:hypothetical protein